MLSTLPHTLKRFFISTLVLFTSCLISAVLPSTAQAQAVGTHLGEGDITFQVKIMDLLASNGAEAGFPVTVMVQSNNSQAEIDALAAGVKRNNFFAIVRINEVCVSADSVRVVAAARQAFGPEAPIEWGNEVNNKKVECGDYSSYQTEYSRVKNQPNVGPSALDFYNGDYPADTFLKAVSLANDDVYFANAYGCIDGTVGDCNPETTETQNTGLNFAKSQPNSQYYLTEFSLSPGGGSSAPDTNLQNVVTFIKTQASKTGAKAITPLIRNVCNDDGEWLLYLDGQVMTRNGSFIDPATCSATDSTKAPYYLYPIESLQSAITNNLGPQAAGAAIANELINQGYEVSCTTPQSLFRASMENWEDYLAYKGDPTFSLVGNQVVNVSQAVDYNEVQYPLFRSSQKADSTNDSIEAHFGYIETDPTISKIGKETKSASLYKLLTQKQQCQYQKNILTTINIMCNKLEDPSACALYQPISNTSYTTETLFQSLQAKDLSCDTSARKIASVEDKKRYDALANTPLYLDKAYRLGFVVFSAQQRGSIDENDNPWDFLFDRPNNPSAQPEHEVRIIAFKLPDIGTNKDKNSDTYYKDPLIITRDSLSPPGLISQRVENYDQKREEFLKGNEFASNLSFPSNEALINCSGPACQDPLGRALVNLVNSGTGNFDQTCRLPNETAKQKLINQVEKSQEIKTTGALNVDTANDTPTSPDTGLGTFFKNGFQLLTNIFNLPQEAKEDPQAFVVKGTSAIDPFQYSTGKYLPEAKFDTYLIYPVGYEYDQVVNTLAGAIKTTDELAEFNNPEKVEPYFILSGIEQNFESEVKEFPYSIGADQGDCPPPTIDPITGETKTSPCERKIEFKALGYINDNDGDDNSDSIDLEPRIKGGLLGQVMRDIQLSLRQVGTDAWYYIESCKTTEEFLLGNCDKNAAAKSQNASGIPQACSELYGADGATPNMLVYDREQTFKHVVTAAQKAAANNSKGMPASEAKRFAQTLWGVLEIEGSPYLRVMRTTQDGATSTISCADSINSCGAVGPLQIIQGACVSDACPYSNLSLLRSFDRPDQLCDLDTALDWTAQNLLTHYDSSITDVNARHAAMAGSHAGLGACDENFSSQPIQGCNAYSYCDCASFGFENRFNDMWALWGNAAPNASILIN